MKRRFQTKFFTVDFREILKMAVAVCSFPNECRQSSLLILEYQRIENRLTLDRSIDSGLLI